MGLYSENLPGSSNSPKIWAAIHVHFISTGWQLLTHLGLFLFLSSQVSFIGEVLFTIQHPMETEARKKLPVIRKKCNCPYNWDSPSSLFHMTSIWDPFSHTNTLQSFLRWSVYYSGVFGLQRDVRVQTDWQAFISWSTTHFHANDLHMLPNCAVDHRYTGTQCGRKYKQCFNADDRLVYLAAGSCLSWWLTSYAIYCKNKHTSGWRPVWC